MPGVGNVIEQLADELSRPARGRAEFLHVRLAYAGADWNSSPTGEVTPHRWPSSSRSRTAAVGDDTHVVAVTGEIDLFTAPGVQAARDRRRSTPASQRVIVDLIGHDVHRLLEPRRADRRAPAAQAARRPLVVVCDNDAIVKTFRITGLDGVFTLVPSLDDALDGDAVGAGR